MYLKLFPFRNNRIFCFFPRKSINFRWYGKWKLNLKKPSNRNSTGNRNNLTRLGRYLGVPPTGLPSPLGLPGPLSLPAHLHQHTAGPSGPDYTAAVLSRGCCLETALFCTSGRLDSWRVAMTPSVIQSLWPTLRDDWVPDHQGVIVQILIHSSSQDVGLMIFLGNESTRHNHRFNLFIKFNIDK